MTATVIATLPKGQSQVRIALDQYAGHDLIDIRVMVKLTESSGIWTATKKGVALQVAAIPELVRALQDAEIKAREMGLIGGPA